ncbi:M43 family zinc metalloprotease [Ascidiimonas aurantiaca]|uniref:M43 family zinc metalloprotease n=1 Tax=Ascidiimonas aurantiaca TaxID=1685432 RepID=UPI0030EBA3FB
MLKKITLFLISFCFFSVSNAQEQNRNCASMDNLEYRMLLDPGLAARMAEVENYTKRKIAQLEQNRIDGDLITIPVVVHVIYSNSQENISLAQIQSQLDVLNEDFRRLNADADNTWSQAADMQIEFCLATVDPNGNATSGITRKSSSRTSWGTNDAMKSSTQGGVDAWDTTQYLNMWVCNIGGGILGYAQFPGGNAATDGVVMSPQYFGSSAKGSGFYLSSPFDLGRTTTHEVGHFLNLRHIWGDGNCNFDDFVADTPSSDAPNYRCATGHVSCGSVDMVQNYMDYSDDACMNLFTQGQKNRMRAVLLPGGIRASLGASDKCSSTPPPPPTCNDGIQNGDETGIDCGGSTCEPCVSNCSENEVTLTITFDNYPEETSWTLLNDAGQTVASGGTYGNQPDGSTLIEDLCLPDDCYTFTINDSFGDGICCTYGSGSYTLTGPGGTLASGGSFTSSEATNFCLGAPPAPTCTDNIQNGDETGIDCGGSACAPCQPGGSVVLHEAFFETGWDNWIDGGSDCARYAGSNSFEGTYSIYIRDNSGVASSMTSPQLDLTPYSEVTLEFYFYPFSMETGEDFFVRYFDGTSWTTVATYTSGSSFTNNSFYVATVTLDTSQYNFAANSQFRMQCDASTNSDLIYVDQVTVTGSSGGAARVGSEPVLIRSMREGVDMGDALLYPNPVSGDFLNVNLLLNPDTSYRIINLLGQTVKSGKLHEQRINVNELQTGVYIFELNDGEEISTQKFIKQ